MTSDLNMRVKELENQNSCLVTVINLLNKEQGNDGNKEQWKTVNNTIEDDLVLNAGTIIFMTTWLTLFHWKIDMPH